MYINGYSNVAETCAFSTFAIRLLTNGNININVFLMSWRREILVSELDILSQILNVRA